MKKRSKRLVLPDYYIYMDRLTYRLVRSVFRYWIAFPKGNATQKYYKLCFRQLRGTPLHGVYCIRVDSFVRGSVDSALNLCGRKALLVEEVPNEDIQKLF